MNTKRISRLVSYLIGLPLICFPLMGQTAARMEVRAAQAPEETRPGKAEVREPGEAPESGGRLQLRAAARPWPDSTVTYTPAGERLSKSVYTYNDAGYTTLAESYRWEGDTWVNSSKTVYTRDAAGNITLYENYRWEGDTWVNSSKTVYAYDAAGHQTLYEYYTWENNQWTGSYKSTYAYDSRGVQILWVNYNWKNNQWVKSRENHYDRKTVNAQVYVCLDIRYGEDGSRLMDFLFVTGSGLNWAYGGKELQYTATYDANNNLTRVETTTLYDGKRVPFQRFVLKYSNNNPVSIEMYGYDGNELGQMEFKAANTYDTRGNRTLSESNASRWDFTTEEYKWIGLDKVISTYDANGNTLSYESYSWDTESGGWIGSWKYVSTYDANGNELSYESYDWDTASGGWKGSNKISYEERNKYGDIMYYKSWSWANNGWEYTSYTVYYPRSGYPEGTERIGEAEPLAYIHGDLLYIRTVRAERIEIYALNGAKVYEGTVPAGTTTLPVDRLPKGVLIVRGSGWTGKVVR